VGRQDVIVTDQAQIVRYAQSQVVDGLEDAEREVIARREDGGRALR